MPQRKLGRCDVVEWCSGSQKGARGGWIDGKVYLSVGSGGDAGGGVGGNDAAAVGGGFGEILRGLFSVCGFSDNTFALLDVRAPTGKINRYRKICQFFIGNIPLLPLNLWDWIFYTPPKL